MWKFSQVLLPAAVSAVAALCSALILWRIKKGRKALVYEIIQLGAPLDDEPDVQEKTIRLSNVGNLPVEGIRYHLAVANGVIDSARFLDPALSPNVDERASSLVATIAFLNPNEELVQRVRIRGAASSVEVSARALGVTASQKRTVEIEPNLWATRTATLALLGIAIVLGVWTFRFRSELASMGAPLVNIASYRLEEGEDVSIVDFPPGVDYVLLTLARRSTAKNSYAEFELEIEDGLGKTVWKSNVVREANRGTLSLELSRRFLSSGDYVIMVYGVAEEGRVLEGRYSIRVSSRAGRRTASGWQNPPPQTARASRPW